MNKTELLALAERVEQEDDPEELGPQAIANGNTPALALTAAALRAIAGGANG